MAYSLQHRRRDYTRYDYVGMNSPELDFDTTSKEVMKFGKFENFSFYITEGPGCSSEVREFINKLRSHKISFLARTNRSNYDSSYFQSAGITVIDLSFTVPSCPPEEPSLKDFHDMIKMKFLQNKRVGVAVQGYEEGAFIIAFALMVMGMTRIEALTKIREFEGEISFSQLQYLRWREKEIREEHMILLTIRRPRGFFSRCVHHFLNAPR